MPSPARQTPKDPARAPISGVFDTNRLSGYLSRTVPGFRAPITVRQFEASAGNPTYFIQSSGDFYILRRQAMVSEGIAAGAVEREFRILAALSARHFPVPRPLIFSDDTSIIGAPFFVMAYVAGRTTADPRLPGLSAAERTAVYDDINITLARLHNFDPAVLGLSVRTPQRFLAREIARYAHIYAKASADPLPEMSHLATWLSGNLPPEQPNRLIHSAFRLESIVLDPLEPKVTAVLDWKAATLGDPLADAVHHLMAWVLPSSSDAPTLAGEDLAALGIPRMADYAAAYARRIGLPELPHLEFYMAFNLFRQAATLSAHASADAVRRLALLGLQLAARAGKSG